MKDREDNVVLFYVGLKVVKVLVDGNAQEREVGILVFFVHFIELGHCQLARGAPCGPELQHHHLASEIREAHGVAVKVQEREFGRVALRGDFFLGFCIAARNKNKQHQ